MPISKRNRVIPTSKTKKNHKDLVKRLHSNVQAACTDYSRIFVFSVENSRSTFLKSVRAHFADSRIFMGKTKVMSVALGRTRELEPQPGTSGLQPYVTGEVGLLFTDRSEDEVKEYFESYSELDYARAGAVASRDFVVPHGELFTAYGVEGGEEDPLPLAIEPTLRRLGVPTRIVKGKVFLEDRPEESAQIMMTRQMEGGAMGGEVEDVNEEGYVVCREGKVLESRQTSILKIFGVRMAEFRIELRAVWDKETAQVKEIEGMDVDEA